MTTNQTINGLPRDLLERITAEPSDIDAQVMRQDAIDELRALLDAPAVVSNGVDWKAVANEQMGIIQALKVDNEKLAGDRARLSTEVETLRPAYKSVLAQLDAAQPQEYLSLGAQLARAATYLISVMDAETEAWTESAALKQALENWSMGEPSAQPQGEPSHWADPAGNTITAELKAYNLNLGGAPAAASGAYTKPLYAGQPAPVAVVLPERKHHVRQGLSHTDAKADGWNACIDEVNRLNTPQ